MFRNPCHRIKMKSEWGSRRNLRCWPEIVLRLCVARAKERQVTRVLKCSCRLFSIINSKSDPRFRPLFFFSGQLLLRTQLEPIAMPISRGNLYNNGNQQTLHLPPNTQCKVAKRRRPKNTTQKKNADDVRPLIWVWFSFFSSCLFLQPLWVRHTHHTPLIMRSR